MYVTTVESSTIEECDRTQRMQRLRYLVSGVEKIGREKDISTVGRG